MSGVSLYLTIFRFKIPDVTERIRPDSEGRTRANNLIFTIWAVFGGFILHFLLSNYLTVLLRPRYEEPVDNAADLIRRDITPFLDPGAYIYRQVFEASPDPNYQELSQKLIIVSNVPEFWDMVHKVKSTGLFARIGTEPWPIPEEEYKDWYRSSETVAGLNPYGAHLTNKKWPLKKVL